MTFKKIKSNKIEYLILGVILAFSAFFRLFRLNSLLGFWYDQGRDALVIWDLIHNGRFFLIGPVTGIEGIFLGPFYYYLLTPFYFLGKGNPVAVATGIQFINVGAVFLIYLIGKKVFNSKVGLLAAFLYGFSYKLVTFSRWLANPAPLPFFSLLTVWCIYRFITTRSSIFIILSSFFIGLCLQLEAASAAFFIPSVLVILIWQRKRLNFKLLFLSFTAFSITLLPQIYFNFRHEGILLTAFKRFLVEEKSFKISFWQTIQKRLVTYYDVFSDNLFPSAGFLKILILASFSAGLMLFRKKFNSSGQKLLLLWLFIPLIGYLFYRGNNGYIWDYYFSGILPVFFIFFSAILCFLFNKYLLGKLLMIIIVGASLFFNLKFLMNYYIAGLGITLMEQKKAIDWIYNEAGNRPFNADFYVPPKIFYSYTYLTKWYGKSEYGREPEVKMVEELYTLYEPDSEHPQFLQAWLERQDGIGKIIKEYSWGNITVQKRERIKYE